MKQSTQRHQSFYFHRLSADAEKARLHVSNFKQQNRTHIDAQISISIRILLNKLSDFRVSANTKGMNTQLRTLHFLLFFSSISSIHYDLFYWIIRTARSALVHQFCILSNENCYTCGISDKCRQLITRRTKKGRRKALFLTVCSIGSQNDRKQKNQSKHREMLHPEKIFLFLKNNLSMLQILRFLIYILKTPSPCKRRNLLWHSGDRMEQIRNVLEYILLLTSPSIPNPSQEFQQRRNQHELEGNHSTDGLHQQSGSNRTSSNRGPPRMNCSGSSK